MEFAAHFLDIYRRLPATLFGICSKSSSLSASNSSKCEIWKVIPRWGVKAWFRSSAVNHSVSPDFLSCGPWCRIWWNFALYITGSVRIRIRRLRVLHSQLRIIGFCRFLVYELRNLGCKSQLGMPFEVELFFNYYSVNILNRDPWQ